MIVVNAVLDCCGMDYGSNLILVMAVVGFVVCLALALALIIVGRRRTTAMGAFVVLLALVLCPRADAATISIRTCNQCAVTVGGHRWRGRGYFYMPRRHSRGPDVFMFGTPAEIRAREVRSAGGLR